MKYEHLYCHEISDGLHRDAQVAGFLSDYSRRCLREAIDNFALPIDAYLDPLVTPAQTR